MPRSYTIARGVLALAAAGFLGFGLAFLVWPLPTARVVDIVLPTADARVDFLATYGGFEIGFGAFLLVCLRRPQRVRLGLLASGCALAGFALARAIGIVTAGPVGPVIYGALALELVGTALSFGAARVAARGSEPA
ncbi:MAG TPA: DUF4345 domain-containing protein [Gemmatimonadales bacterium]|nr:DUF4345 domain-containing protein [Gemmatimonadales bacterium]